MVLKKCILTANNCYKQGTKMAGGKPTGIVVHSTGCNNKTLKRYVQPVITDPNYNELIVDLGKNPYGNHWNQPTPDGQKVCVHAFIGVNSKNEIETIQTLPFDICCWGCAAAPYDKNGKKLYTYKDPTFDHYGPSYNYNPQARIQFEICEDGLTDRNYFEKAFKEAIEFCAHLCEEYGLTSKDICSHYEGYQKGYASNHGDCDHWLKKFGRDMNWFRDEVDKLLKSKSENSANSVLNNGTVYYVQAGAFLSLTNASNLYNKIKAAGFLPQIKKYLNYYKVQVGAYTKRGDATKMITRLNEAGFTAAISTTSGTKISPDETETIRVGDKVMVKAGVTKYTNGVKMLSFVKTAELYVRQIEKNGTVYLVSTLPTGNIYTGRVYAADVYKI